MDKNTFYIIGTPIGNIEDITLRAVRILKEVDVIFAEDTRVTKKLLFHYEIEKTLKRYNEHSSDKSFKNIEELLLSGKSVALVTDSGTPGISDPGFKMVEFVRENLPEIKIRVIPGPSAIVSALSVSGIPSSKFTFLGFPPVKNKRNKFFKNINEIEVKPVVLYESPHRLEKTFNDIIENIGDIDVFVAKEMTKIYENYFLGKVSDAKDYFSGEKSRGEFVIIINLNE